MRLIDADKLKEQFKDREGNDFTVFHFYDAINNAPTVELTEEQAIDKLHETGWLIRHDKEMTERPRGEWINEHYDGLWYHTCNRCKTEIEFDRTVKRLGGENFCRNCGADMRGTKE